MIIKVVTRVSQKTGGEYKALIATDEKTGREIFLNFNVSAIINLIPEDMFSQFIKGEDIILCKYPK